MSPSYRRRAHPPPPPSPPEGDLYSDSDEESVSEGSVAPEGDMEELDDLLEPEEDEEEEGDEDEALGESSDPCMTKVLYLSHTHFNLYKIWHIPICIFRPVFFWVMISP